MVKSDFTANSRDGLLTDIRDGDTRCCGMGRIALTELDNDHYSSGALGVLYDAVR